MSKKQCKIWLMLAVDRKRRRVIAYEVGSRSKATIRKMLAKLSAYRIKKICTDKWKIYRALIPQDQLVQSKKETYTIESINCNVRHYLSRFRRKTRCYSKSVYMVKSVVSILFENHLLPCISVC